MSVRPGAPLGRTHRRPAGVGGIVLVGIAMLVASVMAIIMRLLT
ncbi:MAG TPA: hypothetical protein VMF51_08295 [Nocardioides sp.]|nr:hypothetical protein [Nocardioides sp.]HTW15115.1 hypothetical protein [Nocardioides sp.]